MMMMMMMMMMMLLSEHRVGITDSKELPVLKLG
jgi:hypothetical protein